MTKQFKPNLIMFDLDGTLVDSVPDLAFCVDLFMEELGRPTHGEAKVRNWVGNGVQRLCERALTDSLDGYPDKQFFEENFPRFMDIYAEHNGKKSTLYPGVKETLAVLKETGFKLACVTNKSERFTPPLLEKLGILQYFQFTLGGDVLPKKKPDPMPLLHIAKTLDEQIENCLLVGDSMNDVQAARNAGCPVIAVPYGYNHGKDIHESNPDVVIKTFFELPPLVGVSDTKLAEASNA